MPVYKDKQLQIPLRIIIAALLFLVPHAMAQTTQPYQTPAPDDNIWRSKVPSDSKDPHNVAALGKLCLFVLAMFSIFMFPICVNEVIKKCVKNCKEKQARQERQERQAEQENLESASSNGFSANAPGLPVQIRHFFCSSRPPKAAEGGVEMAKV